MNYNFDIEKLIQQWLPYMLRSPSVTAFLAVLLSPLNPILADFLLFATNTRIELMQNGQVIRLENLLNDTFDNDLRRISITDAAEDFLMIGDTSPTMIGDDIPLIIPYGDTDDTVDFVVKVPLQDEPFLIGDDAPIIIGDVVPLIIPDAPPDGLINRIKRVVQKYKISGKSFVVQEI